eukprot:2244636-Pleurochrysis_carterae.AAC.5
MKLSSTKCEDCGEWLRYAAAKLQNGFLVHVPFALHLAHALDDQIQQLLSVLVDKWIRRRRHVPSVAQDLLGERALAPVVEAVVHRRGDKLVEPALLEHRVDDREGGVAVRLALLLGHAVGRHVGPDVE